VAVSAETLSIHGTPLDKFKVASLGRSASVVPIKVQSEVIGLLIVVRKADREIDKVAQSLLEAVADYASISLVNGRLFQVVQQNVEAARTNEKNRMAMFESLRESIRQEMQVSMYPLEALLSGKPGPLTAEQEQALKTMPNFRAMKDHVEMTITSDGLRIELLETEAGMFFESGRPMPTPSGAELLARLAEELGKLPNNLLIEGHTDAKPFVTAGGAYSNWELSADRANAARRKLLQQGVAAAQIYKVSGVGDTQPMESTRPGDEINRRVSVQLKVQEGSRVDNSATNQPKSVAKAP